MLDLGHTKRLGHTMGVSVDDVACDRWWDKRVCDRLSEILRTPTVCLQLVSPLNGGPKVASASKFWKMFRLMDAEMVIELHKNGARIEFVLKATTRRGPDGRLIASAC